MVNYSNGKIYKIEPLNGEDGDIYIGSTTKDYLSQRMDNHRRNYRSWKKGNVYEDKLMSFTLFDKYGLENCFIILLELVNANSVDELKAREAYYIRNLKCVNKCIPLRTSEEYHKTKYKENKSVKLKQSNDYYLENKEVIKSKRREKYLCDCGAIVCVGYKQRHIKTTKHQKYLESINNNLDNNI
jgi:hypothetical protein